MTVLGRSSVVIWAMPSWTRLFLCPRSSPISTLPPRPLARSPARYRGLNPHFQARAVEIEASAPFSHLLRCFSWPASGAHQAADSFAHTDDHGDDDFIFKSSSSHGGAGKAPSRLSRVKHWLVKTCLPQPWSCPLVKDQDYCCFAIVTVDHVFIDGLSINFEQHLGELNINGFTRILAEGEARAALNKYRRRYGPPVFGSPAADVADEDVKTKGTKGCAQGKTPRVPRPPSKGQTPHTRPAMPNQLRIYVKRCRDLPAEDHNMLHGTASSDP